SAEQGYGPGCYNLAVLYERGEVVERDDSTAFKWYLRGSEQGYVPSQLKTGIAYLKGAGTEQSLNQAGRWLGHAAAAGDQSAQATLAALLSTTEPQKAVELFHQAAVQHNPYAHYQLALIYSEPKLEQPQDLDKALMHASESMRLGHVPANALIESLNQQLALQQSDLSSSKRSDVLSETDNQADVQTDTVLVVVKKTEVSNVVALEAPGSEVPEVSAVKLKPQQTKSETVIDAEAMVSMDNGLRDFKWLKSQSSGRYVLQLIQLAKVSSVKKFLKDNKLEGRANYFRALTNAGRVYVVLYADSANTPAEARKLAKNQLPASISDQVWFRSYRAIQNAYQPAD
ncbi:MAG: SEL1-like repeat protein, partial [Amphritea sp.]|nr:SEL1-like repeat protein [Amphritea sp.]